MKIEEANKICAEYMELNFVMMAGDVVIMDATGKVGGILNYGKSLDALVPVWEKLGLASIKLVDFGCVEKRAIINTRNHWQSESALTIQEAAVISTAKAIQGLAETKEKLEVAVEFITDCSVSHEESRYKYRTQIALKQINNTDKV